MKAYYTDKEREREEFIEEAGRVARAVIYTLGFALLCCFMYSCMDSPAQAGEITDARAINAIIGEAEGEGYEGMKAIACGIRNRGTLKGVYGETAPRVINKKYSEDVKAKAMVAWATSEDPTECAFIDGADHWGGIQIDGAWIANMRKAGFVQTAKVGNTLFFRKEEK